MLTSSDLWGGGGKRSRTPKVFYHVLLPGQKVAESSALIMAPQTFARKAGDKVFGCLADITLADSGSISVAYTVVVRHNENPV